MSAASPPAVVVRPLDQVDLPLLYAVYGRAFGEPYPGPALRDLVETPGAFTLVALLDSARPGMEPVGFVVARAVADEGEILSIGVDPRSAVRGAGRALMLAAEALARGRGARSMFLEVAVDNERARRLYAGLAYETAGLRRNYYRRRSGVSIDALILRKRLEL